MDGEDDETTGKSSSSQQVELYTNKHYENLDDSEEEENISTDPKRVQKKEENVISIDPEYL